MNRWQDSGGTQGLNPGADKAARSHQALSTVMPGSAACALHVVHKSGGKSPGCSRRFCAAVAGSIMQRLRF